MKVTVTLWPFLLLKKQLICEDMTFLKLAHKTILKLINGLQFGDQTVSLDFLKNGQRGFLQICKKVTSTAELTNMCWSKVKD